MVDSRLCPLEDSQTSLMGLDRHLRFPEFLRLGLETSPLRPDTSFCPKATMPE